MSRAAVFSGANDLARQAANVRHFGVVCVMLRILTILLLLCSTGHSQSTRPYPLPPGVRGKACLMESRFAPFPDSLRNAQPRVYNGKTYSAAEHYSDSSVLVFMPDYFDKKKPYELVFWFHGWYNNIDSSLRTFRLLEQFYAARRNAIFVFPEGPKNAPDSYGGKLEKENGLANLLNEIETFLGNKKRIDYRNVFPIVTLSGHSGAYRAIGKSSKQLTQRILLFDGLYGEMDNYLLFCTANNYFLHIYTDDGGTKENSLQFMKTLTEKGIPFLHKEEDEVTEEELKNNRIIFLHSKKGHNEVITHQNNFERFLKALK
jgi:hypothetical protein